MAQNILGPVKGQGIRQSKVQIRLFWTNFYNLDLSKMIWPVRNHFEPIEGQGIKVRFGHFDGLFESQIETCLSRIDFLIKSSTPD